MRFLRAVGRWATSAGREPEPGRRDISMLAAGQGKPPESMKRKPSR